MSSNVYFDTTVWSFLVKPESEPQLRRLQRARNEAGVRIMIGSMGMEELAHIPDGTTAASALRTFSEFMAPPGLFRDLPDIVNNAIHHVLSGVPYVPTLPESESREVLADAEKLVINGLPPPILAETKRQKADWLQESIDHFRLARQCDASGLPDTFHEFQNDPCVEAYLHELLVGIAERIIRRKVRKHEVKRLKARCHLSVPLQMLLSWAALEVFNEVKRGIPPRRNDNRDMRHAIVAAHAAIFVTDDKPLSDFLCPAKDKLPFRLMNLVEFLTSLGSSSL